MFNSHPSLSCIIMSSLQYIEWVRTWTSKAYQQKISLEEWKVKTINHLMMRWMNGVKKIKKKRKLFFLTQSEEKKNSQYLSAFHTSQIEYLLCSLNFISISQGYLSNLIGHLNIYFYFLFLTHFFIRLFVTTYKGI